MTKTYKSREPVLVNAVQFSAGTVEEIKDLANKAKVNISFGEDAAGQKYVEIEDEGETLTGYLNWYIVFDESGYCYPCSPTEFKRTFEEMELLQLSLAEEKFHKALMGGPLRTHNVTLEELKDKIKRLKAQVPEWMPISEAPKNRPVLVRFFDREGAECIEKAFYAMKYTLGCDEYHVNEGWADYHEESGEWFAPEGWYTYPFEGSEQSCDPLAKFDLLEFMPLPRKGERQ